ncbi:RNA polymerase sigma-70 factor, ECF subfamily [Aquiflexum balticum DSM 16537]|uniref:RNA polymerase sigma-70 factor, ECF subfamily n=1 Tax=Aquiflexum balticum DSM 16537 TaxID=758820 RepID=A0A1W2H4S8_9BACT|nr:RNA polymerase sigma-70 factor [Aquiflexum balticum]SMD43889.1 RNA polymerase sigma-70 factor, ECF subfamily [Aquiflexum balticum DSM 16537]
MQATDQQVFSNIQSGDTASFEMLFKTHYNPLCRFALSFLKDPDDAEETVQAVFIGIWEKKATIQVDTSIKSYLYRSVRNACLNEIKHQKVRQLHAGTVQAEGEPRSQPSDHLAIRKELESKIQEALETLPEQCKLIFKMSRFEELKYQEIAAQLQLSVKTVENQMGKALKLMRIQLKDYLPLITILIGRLLEP